MSRNLATCSPSSATQFPPQNTDSGDAPSGPFQHFKTDSPFFFKQWGEWAFEGQHDAGGTMFVWPGDCEGEQRVGKRRAGSTLDGVEHKEWPR